MLPLTLEGDTLGEKHRHFNKLVQDAITNKQYNLTQIDSNENDIDNLFKIDLACKIKNLNYIMEVLKCNDILYVSKAIKNSSWLITEQEYTHIINPEYLYTQLFPHMLNKAISKLLLHIRIHLKDETRCKEFYDYFKGTSYGTYKWLLNCSIPVIENVIQKEWNIPLHQFKRLCKLSVKFLHYYNRVEQRNREDSLKAVSFLITSDTEEYLKAIHSAKKYYSSPSFGRKSTEVIMKTCSQIILQNFEEFIIKVDVPTVVKYINKDEIKNHLFQYLKIFKIKYCFKDFDNIKYFILKIPKEDRFQFVKRTFIDNSEAKWSPPCLAKYVNSYFWYQYAPFNVAFIELKKLIRAENLPVKRYALLQILITCAKCNNQNIKTVLQYYCNEHRNEPSKFKLQFINNILKQTNFNKFDTETGNILEELFYSLQIYNEPKKIVSNKLQFCLKSILLHKVLHDQNIPDVIKEKIIFDTFKKFQSKLTEEQKNKLFSYLLSSLYVKIQNATLNTEPEFNEALDLLKTVLNLLMDWKKDVTHYPFVLNKINELIKIKRQNSWTSKKLTTLYTINKSWRKQMFNISMDLYPSEEVCINALKHDPQLLTHYNADVDILRRDDTVSLRRLLTKLRIYWPDSLAKEWANAYFNSLKESTSHKALVTGIFELLPQHKILDTIVMKYVPEDSNICGLPSDQNELSLRKNIAKQMYIARPMISLDVVLRYAEGDYLEYTVPSLNAMIQNVSNIQGRFYTPNFLQAPDSLQKFGLRLAFNKLKYDELIPMYLDVWNTTQNSSIQVQILCYTHGLLCSVIDPSTARKLWEILSKFIEDLPAIKNKYIFKKLSEVKNIHVSVQGDFFMKSYEFLTSQVNCETHLNALIDEAPDLMSYLDADFVAEKVLAPTAEKNVNHGYKYINVMTSYILHGQNAEEQCIRCKRVLIPTLEKAFKTWDIVENDKYVTREYVNTLLTELVQDSCKFLCLRRIIVPVKLFTCIKDFMENDMPLYENYILCTSWKLTSEYMKLVAENKTMFYDSRLNNLCAISFDKTDIDYMPDDAVVVWESIVTKMSPKLGPIFTQQLMNDYVKYFPSVTMLFYEALNKTFLEHFNFQSCLSDMEIMKYMIVDHDFIPSYLVVCYKICRYGGDYVQSKMLELRKILSAHPSKEIQYHYGEAFGTLSVSLP